MSELTPLAQLKFNLQESQFPYFSDDDLTTLLILYPNINRASYEGCLIKSSNDSVSLGPINTPNNEQYWLRRANHFKALWNRDERTEQRASNGGSGLSWQRADE